MRVSKLLIPRLRADDVIAPGLNVIERVIGLKRSAVVGDDVDNWGESRVVPDISRLRIAYIDPVTD